MPFIPHTEADIREMLAAIGVADINDLFDEISAGLRAGRLNGIPDWIASVKRYPVRG